MGYSEDNDLLLVVGGVIIFIIIGGAVLTALVGGFLYATGH